jgi:serine/threonine protein kinase
MAAPATVEQFVETLQHSGLFDKQALATIRKRFTDSSHVRAEPAELARSLIRDGLLTEFQAKLLLAGRRRGFLLRDRYKVLDQLGSGGMATVYLCEDIVQRRKVALKVLPPRQAADPVALERFRREARAVSVLNHPNIVCAYEMCQDAELHFLVLEYVEGISLQDLVQKEGPLAPNRAADCICQAAAGLQHAHEAGLVHRDIKPANLLLTPGGSIKVLDLGLARFFNDDQDNLTQEHDSRSILGTADYLAPEQAVDSHGVDIRADIYSLGCTFYFLLSGKAPFADKTVTQKLIHHQTCSPEPIRGKRPEVPKEMAAVLDRMMAKNLSKRYQTPGEVVAALQPWSKTVVSAGGAQFQASRKYREAEARRRRLLTIGGGIALVLGLALFLSLLLSRSAAPTSPLAGPAAPADDSIQLTHGLRDHWRLMEGFGDVGTSHLPRGGTPCHLEGSTWDATGHNNRATLRFNGGGQWLSVMNTGYDFGNTFSLCAWIKLDTDARDYQALVADKPAGNEQNGFLWFVHPAHEANRKLQFESGNGKEGANVSSKPGAVALGKWEYVAVTVDRPAKVARLYVNGTDVTAGGTVRPDFNTKAHPHIGTVHGGGCWFKGAMDDIRVYSRVLTPAEVAALAKLAR